MKIVICLLLLMSCATASREPEISHADRTYRTCSEKETADAQKYACWRYCYKRWFVKKCKLILIDRTSPKFDDFVIIHKSKLKK